MATAAILATGVRATTNRQIASEERINLEWDLYLGNHEPGTALSDGLLTAFDGIKAKYRNWPRVWQTIPGFDRGVKRTLAELEVEAHSQTFRRVA